MLREHPPYRQSATGRAAVSSAHPIATAAGVEMLAKGGNVVDAAVAVSFALGVVEPDASGPGGYGQMLIYQKGMDRPQLIEFMTRVPEDVDIDAADARRRVRAVRDEGAALVNVPGTVAAMYLAWQKYGSKKLTWSESASAGHPRRARRLRGERRTRDDARHRARAVPQVRRRRARCSSATTSRSRSATR